MSTYRGSGCREFDLLLGGGIVPEEPYILDYEPGAWHMVFITNYLNEGLRAGEFMFIVTSDLTYSKLLAELENRSVNIHEALKKEQLTILDVSGAERSLESPSKSIIVSSDPKSDQKVILEIADLAQEAEEKLTDGKFNRASGALLSLTSLLLSHDGKHPYRIARKVVSSIIGPRVTFLTALGDRVLRKNEQAAVESLFSGIIELRVARSRDGRCGKQIRVSASPLPDFIPHEVPYEVVKNTIVMSPTGEGVQRPR
jgi:KaiC/GvpD/RAD55 family RecA-like ATPase